MSHHQFRARGVSTCNVIQETNVFRGNLILIFWSRVMVYAKLRTIYLMIAIGLEILVSAAGFKRDALHTFHHKVSEVCE